MGETFHLLSPPTSDENTTALLQNQSNSRLKSKTLLLTFDGLRFVVRPFSLLCTHAFMGHNFSLVDGANSKQTDLSSSGHMGS
jgi:hypothetical protein